MLNFEGVDVVASGPFVVVESVDETGIDVDSVASVVFSVVNFVDNGAGDVVVDISSLAAVDNLVVKLSEDGVDV